MSSSSPMTSIITILILLTAAAPVSLSLEQDPVPTPWPEQFYSLLMINYTGALQIIDLWYDWPNGRNFNIIQHQLEGITLYDLEWNNGTTFLYRLDESKQCRRSQIDVGILAPNWLDGAEYLGQRHVDGFLCNAWNKVDFLMYYEDVETKRPVHWMFYTGRGAHVMTFEVGAVLEDVKWQAPVYCFDKKAEAAHDSEAQFSITGASEGGLPRGPFQIGI